MSLRRPAPLLSCLLLLMTAWPSSQAAEEDPTTPRFTMEFHQARLGQILRYLSEQAGYVIIEPLEIDQTISLIAHRPLAPAEAVAALNAALFDRGYAAIVRGQTLRIMALPKARQQNLPVSLGSDPQAIPDDQQIITHIIPVHHATARDLVDNLGPLLDAAATSLSANEATNTLVLTAARSDVRRVAAIVQAIDRSVSGEQQVQVFHLAHAEALSVARIITDIYASDARTTAPTTMRVAGRGMPTAPTTSDTGQARGFSVAAVADQGTNSVVVRAASAVMPVITDMVQRLDQDTWTQDAVLVYPVRNGKATDIAASLTELFQGTTTTARQTRQTAADTGRQGGTASGLELHDQVRVVANEASNTVLLLTPERNFTRLGQLLDSLDQPRRQVLVRVLVAEVTVTDDLDIGVEMELIDRNRPGNRVSSDFNIFDSTLGLGGFLLNGSDFRATLRALASQTSFDVLSRPYVLTTDNQTAVVNVSQEVPIISGTRTDQDNNVTTTFDRRDVGIILTITPQINSEGLVVLDIGQELSALAEQGIPIAAGVNAPIINKRTMTTRVGVASGQTVVIGGLVQDVFSEVRRKVPLLGDIPVLGWFFRRTERTNGQTELMIFLTPQVINGPEELRSMSDQLRAEATRLNAAVAQGLLQHHLDRLAQVPLGQAVTPAGSPEEP